MAGPLYNIKKTPDRSKHLWCDIQSHPIQLYTAHSESRTSAAGNKHHCPTDVPAAVPGLRKLPPPGGLMKSATGLITRCAAFL